MTMTVKLPAPLERSLRQRGAAVGRPASELIREALQAYLDAAPPSGASAYALGEDLFGRHRGPADLASSRKDTLTGLWAEKHGRRAATARRG